MTVVNIDVKDLGGIAHHDDRVAFRAPNHRTEGDQVVSTAAHTVMLVDGIGSTNLSPGPAVVRLHCQGVSDNGEKQIVVPDDGPVALAELLEGAFTYTPAVVSRVARDAAAAAAAAVRAEGVADAFGSLEGVVDQVQAAEAAASSAEADRLVVEQAATSASWSGDRLTVLGATSPPLTGEPGPAGAAPYVGANGNWWVGDTDTGVRAQGEKGDSGDGAGDVLWSELNPILDGKANVGDVPVTDDGYNSHDASAPASDYPSGVSYGMNNAVSHGWNAAIQADTGYTNHSNFKLVQTLRQGGYSKSTTQLVFTYDDEHKPVFMRKWYGAAWGPFRSLTDDGHTHSQYAESSRVTALEGSQPIIVSSLPSSPLPGRIYLVTG